MPTVPYKTDRQRLEELFGDIRETAAPYVSKRVTIERLRCIAQDEYVRRVLHRKGMIIGDNEPFLFKHFIDALIAYHGKPRTTLKYGMRLLTALNEGRLFQHVTKESALERIIFNRAQANIRKRMLLFQDVFMRYLGLSPNDDTDLAYFGEKSALLRKKHVIVNGERVPAFYTSISVRTYFPNLPEQLGNRKPPYRHPHRLEELMSMPA